MKEIIGNTLKAIPAGYFDPEAAGRFAASPEALQTIQRIKDKYGLTVEIVPMAEDAPPWAAGYFKGDGPGGSNDPEVRRVYLGDNPSLFTLEHELGHAVDPYFVKSHQNIIDSTNLFYDKYNKGQLRTPAERLENYMLTSPRNKLDSELTAQRYALDRMKEAGLEDDQSRQDLRMYPLAYIDQGIRNVELYEMGGGMVPDSALTKKREIFDAPYTAMFPEQVRTSYMPDMHTRVEFGDEVARRLLMLGLDKEFQKAKDKEKSRSMDYATRRMGY